MHVAGHDQDSSNRRRPYERGEPNPWLADSAKPKMNTASPGQSSAIPSQSRRWLA